LRYGKEYNKLQEVEKSVKKLIALALVSVLSLSLASCVTKDNNQSNNSSPSNLIASLTPSQSASSSPSQIVATAKPNNDTDEIATMLNETEKLLTGLDKFNNNDIAIPKP